MTKLAQSMAASRPCADVNWSPEAKRGDLLKLTRRSVTNMQPDAASPPSLTSASRQMEITIANEGRQRSEATCRFSWGAPIAGSACRVAMRVHSRAIFVDLTWRKQSGSLSAMAGSLYRIAAGDSWGVLTRIIQLVTDGRLAKVRLPKVLKSRDISSWRH